MITSFEVGAVFKIINEASPALKTMLKQVRDLTAAVEKAKVGLASLNKELLPSSGLTAAVAETGAAGMKDMGKVIAALKAKYAGQMDFGKASGLVKAALSS